MPPNKADLEARRKKLDKKKEKPIAKIEDFSSPFLTIGIPTYDDFDGAIFSLMNMRINHPNMMQHCEFILIDDNPGSAHGDLNRKIFSNKQVPNGRYIATEEWLGPWQKGKIFYEAKGHACLVMDSHVMIYPGVLSKLIEYYLRNPDTKDILHGPLVYDNLASVSTHFHPRWSGQMWGQWATDARGQDPAAEPFEIWGNGMGLFSARTQHWKDIGGFNPMFKGFGAEEGYIHEKFRQNGGKAMCLPFMRWWHRFDRIVPTATLDLQGRPKLVLKKGPDESPYPLSWQNKVRNYVIGFLELGLDVEPILHHFSRWQPRAVLDQFYEAVKLEVQQQGGLHAPRSLPHADVQQVPPESGPGGRSSTIISAAGVPGEGAIDLQRLFGSEATILASLSQGVQPRPAIPKPGGEAELDDLTYGS